MIRVLFIGLWVCIVTLISSYGAAYWAAGAARVDGEDAHVSGIEYRRMPSINIPMIIDGSVRGYVIAKLVYTAENSKLRQLGIDPQAFVTSAAFEEVYTNGRIDTGKLAKYNLKEMLDNIKATTNKKLNGDVIQDVLVDSINYIDKNDMRKMAEAAGSQGRGEADKAAKPAN
ncbi:hypothetical protein ABLE91_01950 [Aquabacter sp. CN5-332]|uniref:hypothetical protein n=1 Tax=Aquabacter sp. CN5-332 TaxID=3156608 RepID=UPI0032B3E7B4